MRFPPQARPHASLLRAVGTALFPAGLLGCGAADGSPGLFATVALLLVATLAGGLGAWLAHTRNRQALRETRETLRQTQQLRSGWHWTTDAEHRVQTWSAPGQPPIAGAPDALFEIQPLLRQRLEKGQSFDGLRLQAGAAWQGSFGWRLSGRPRHDAAGAFAGFAGSAHPTDAEDALQLAAAALPAALAACTEPTLLALEARGTGLDGSPRSWQLQAMNAAAQAVFPSACTGQALGPVLLAWPEVNSALQGLAQDTPVQEVQGWRIVAVAGTGDILHAAVLTRLQQGMPAAQPASAVAAAMSPDGAADQASADAEGDTFTFTLTHDLRAPIRVVEGFTRIVKEDYGRHLDRVGNDHLDRVLGAAARMNLMIDALLTLARLSRQPLARQRVNLTQLAGYVIDDLRRGAPERLADVDIEPQLTAWGDPTLLRLVLENLLGNAWKYTGRCAHAQISLRVMNQGSRTAFVVRDNGAGFDMRSADRLFGLFQRLHSASDFPGHGVGLASVRRIVRRHGGDIWAEAEPGRGASFYFTLAA